MYVHHWSQLPVPPLTALQVDSAWQAGDHVGAKRLSATARGWNLAGMIVGGVVYVLVVVAAIASSAA